MYSSLKAERHVGCRARHQVENLLTWPEEHRKRFRERSKHVFMRLIRKFGCVLH